jgi:hypothetical protein
MGKIKKALLITTHTQEDKATVKLSVLKLSVSTALPDGLAYVFRTLVRVHARMRLHI